MSGMTESDLMEEVNEPDNNDEEVKREMGEVRWEK